MYSAHSTAKKKPITIKQYEGTRAKEVGLSLYDPVKQLLILRFQRCIAAAKFSQRVMYGPCFLIYIFLKSY